MNAISENKSKIRKNGSKALAALLAALMLIPVLFLSSNAAADSAGTKKSPEKDLSDSSVGSVYHVPAPESKTLSFFRPRMPSGII